MKQKKGKPEKQVFFRVDGVVENRVPREGDPDKSTLTDDQAAPYVQRAKVVFDVYLDGLQPSQLTAEAKLRWLQESNALIHENLDALTLPFFVQMVVAHNTSRRAADSVTARHNKPTSKHKHTQEQCAKLRLEWASGKFSSREQCAEQECGALGISFAIARKALRNEPEPNRRG